MGTTPIASIDASGITKPVFNDVLSYFQTAYKSIYGQDCVIEASTPDGQFLALVAAAVDDCNAQTVAVYNSFSPATAQGVGLSTVVKINGITRKRASYSSADVFIVGVAGTVIPNGLVTDEAGFRWALPATVTIPSAGEVIVTATCQTIGAVQAAVGTINSIFTPVPGWQTVENLAAAVPGAPVETDAELRQRQAYSAALPSIGSFPGLVSAIAAIPGVSRYRVYENPKAGTDSLGITGHSIAVVVDGGDAQTITDVIGLKKSQGVGTFGTLTQQTTPDQFGLSRSVTFSRPQALPITYRMHVRPLLGFTSDIQAQIQQSLSDWTNSLGIGSGVLLSDAHASARLMGTPYSRSFSIDPASFLASNGAGPPVMADIPAAYNEAPYCQPDYVAITLVTG